MATYVDNVALVRSLIDVGANVNIADREGTTPLSLARRKNFREIGRLLAAAGAR